MSYLLASVGFILGVVFGSFINALAYRLPRGETLVTRSHCTSCFTEIKARDNIPVLSWFILRGRCRACKAPYSFRYPFVEFVTGVVFALLTVRALDFGEGFVFAALAFLAFAFSGMLLTLIDLDTRKLPAPIVYATLTVTLASIIGYQLLTGDSSRTLTALVSMGGYFIVYWLMWLLKPGAVGYGDVRLSLLLGLMLGWISIPVAILGFFLPWFLAMIWLIPQMMKKKANSKTAIPFGPWLILGSVLSLLYGEIIVGYYLQLGGI